ncbi:MAG: 5S rRNA maturation endonuclease (ribonuclease M5), partial [Nitrospinales bacterium]
MNINSQPSSKELKEAISDLCQGLQNDGFIQKKLYPYTNQDGEVIYWRFRSEHKDGRKTIHPLSKNGLVYQLKEPTFVHGKPLYHLPDIFKNPNAVVLVVEGENCVDALSELGIVATTSGSTSSASGADWTPLSGRKVTVWADNDKAGKDYAGKVLKVLEKLNCDVSLIEVDKLSLPEKGDCVDYLELHPAATKSDIESLPMVHHEPSQGEDWQNPENIVTELYPVAPFELNMLPEAFRDWIGDAALRMQCPTDF